MTFSALTTLQTVLLGFFAAGTVIFLYLIKLPHRRHFVSSALVWQRVLDGRRSRSLSDILRRIISILMAVVIALLLALSLGKPEIIALTGRKERVVIVMDTSPTMATRTLDGRTRWEHALDRAVPLVGGGSPGSEYCIADTSGRSVMTFTADRSEIWRELHRLAPGTSQPQLPGIDATASQIYFVTDGVAIHDLPKALHAISVFQPADNVGITAFGIRPAPSGLTYAAYLEVENFGSRAAEVAITIDGNTGENIGKIVRISERGTIRELFDLSKFQGGAIRARIQCKGDALSIDDAGFAYLPVRRKTRVQLVSAGNVYLEKLLKLDSHVTFFQTDPAHFDEARECDAYVFDQFAPRTAPSRPALIIGAPSAPWLCATHDFVREPDVISWVESHPLMQHVSLHDLSIERAARIDPAGFTVIAASRQTPLIVVSEEPRWVLLSFALDSSDFPLHAGFPVFVENVLAWFCRAQLELERTPGMVEVPLANAEISVLDGTKVPSVAKGQTTIFEASEPGLYTATRGETEMHIAVNFAGHSLSDVNRSALKEDTASASLPVRPRLQSEIWAYMLLAAVALIVLEWFTYHRGITL